MPPRYFNKVGSVGQDIVLFRVTWCGMHLSKKCSAFRVVLSALLLVALLQLLYLSFLTKFQSKQQQQQQHQRYRYPEPLGGSGPGSAAHSEKNSRKERLRYSLSSGGIFDQSGQYRVYKNLIQKDFASKPGTNVLTLVTHTSMNNLHHLQDLVERWRNPLSVAIFAHGQDVKLATALVYALGALCPRVQTLVDFHLVCLSGETASFPEDDHRHFAGLDDCAAVFSRLEAHKDRYRNYAMGADVPYPNNLLRNVARGGTESSFILVIDIDMMPAADLHQQFVAMVGRRQLAPDQVFVLPAFEIRHTRKIPASKAELVQLYQPPPRHLRRPASGLHADLGRPVGAFLHRTAQCAPLRRELQTVRLQSHQPGLRAPRGRLRVLRAELGLPGPPRLQDPGRVPREERRGEPPQPAPVPHL
ncbi:beta-1,4-glucuronyltransferase 1 isoform X2 [Hippocampus comes]|uniref:beta-1,4-glucuronyltransferase 1 isoform X2 n=1 Tax=Hippocampus comes TaxID=109280 RepID=UPI00094E578A|nr:PREDICTED: beta-1,4-glucuronyltransferase 1 isoform X2 [Hippocampus comes]